jgi:glycosyltransferase involved in cell wall biosynthesis
MRTVLLTSTYFSSDTFLGCLRINALAKFLPEHGWRPVVLTPDLPTPPALPRDAVEIVEYADARAVYSRLKRRLGGTRYVQLAESGAAGTESSRARGVVDTLVERAKHVVIPDPSVVWWLPGVRAATRWARTHHVDCVLTSSNPIAPHFIGASLRRQLGVPWVADFRDLWTLNHYYPYGPLRRSVDAALERRVMRGADAIVTLSDEYIERLRAFYHHDDRPYYAVPLGYDPEILVEVPPPPSSDFTLTFTGNFVEGKRDPELLFEGIRRAIDRGGVDARRLRIDFYGPRYAWIGRRAEAAGLSEQVRQHGYVSRNEALERQRNAQLLLLFLWDHPAERGAYSGKMEYLAAKRPILAVSAPEGGIWERLLEKTGAGVSARDADAVADAVCTAHAEFTATGTVAYRGDAHELDRFSYVEITRTFAGILDDTIRR